MGGTGGSLSRPDTDVNWPQEAQDQVMVFTMLRKKHTFYIYFILRC